MIRLAIGEDHQSFIDGIKLITEFEDDVSIVGTANDGEALLKLVKLKQPNVVITDLRMPKIDGIEVTKQILEVLPHTKILVFTMFDTPDALRKAKDAGAVGYILKNASLDDVLNAVRVIYSGKNYFDKSIQATKQTIVNKDSLTKRQKEILALIAQGKTSRQIADLLFIDILTVNTHRQNMIRILGLHGKTELVKYAIDQKYLF